ncbi:MAG: hypothetical protein CVT92_02705 [Bacteroidetes bacterium HGW-Bacteroidetes-1]|jgi:hypothetical protein|nr:MAG: hypothetical protein CVT92_02705 [Bacteroidetes bacterium HGW-Bacteroidetes-1]
MTDNIDNRIQTIKDLTIEQQLEYANKERIRLASLLAEKEKITTKHEKEKLKTMTIEDVQKMALELAKEYYEEGYICGVDGEIQASSVNEFIETWRKENDTH